MNLTDGIISFFAYTENGPIELNVCLSIAVSHDIMVAIGYRLVDILRNN